MIKLLFFAAILSLICKLLTQRWPWELMGTKPTRSQALFRANKLLGTRADASRTEVIEAHKRLIALVHPDLGGTNDQVHEANAARDLLLDEMPG